MITILSSIMLLWACSSGAPITDTTRPRLSELEATATYWQNRLREGSPPAEMRNIRYGTSGYLYIIANDGRVSFHPDAALCGHDFSRMPQIKKMLSERNGSFEDQAPGIKRRFIFRDLQQAGILCLVIDPFDIEGP